MTRKTLGRLEPVELRDIWTSESAEFTPWLARPENLSVLGETLGTDLELEAQERAVGPFRADILCKDIATDSWVLVENQWRWCADAGRPTRFKPSSPSPTDAVRDGSAKLGHPVQNVTREHGLTPLPR